MMNPRRSMLCRGNDRRRGAQLIEFALVLPLFLFLILFSLDMGRMVFYSGVVHDATYTAARAGAQVGAAGTSQRGASRTAFDNAVREIPGAGGPAAAKRATFTVQNGTTCNRGVSSPDRFVRVRGTISVDFVTPGLTTLLSIAGGGGRVDPVGSWQLPAVGVARCEIVRS